MRTWGWLLGLLGWLVCFVAGVLALFAALNPHGAGEILDYGTPRLAALANNRNGLFWMVGTGSLLLAVLALASVVSRWLSPGYLTFAGERGQVLVDTSTIEECLRKVLADEEGVTRSRVALRAGRSHIDCQVAVWLSAGADLLDRVRQMQARLQDYYAFILPGAPPLRIEVRTKLVYKGAAPAAGARPGAGTGRARSGDDESYGGPRYPVDAGDADSGGMTSS